MQGDGLVAPARVHVGMMPDGQRRRADDEVVHADFRLLDLIELLPKRKKIRDVVVDGQIEVRDRPG